MDTGRPRRNLKVLECIRKRIDGHKVRERSRRQSTRQRRDGGKGAHTIIADTIKGKGFLYGRRKNQWHENAGAMKNLSRLF